jgi:hypothetical protein
VVKRLLGGEATLGLADEFLDKILGIVAYLVPLFSVEIKYTLLYHL